MEKSLPLHKKKEDANQEKEDIKSRIAIDSLINNALARTDLRLATALMNSRQEFTDLLVKEKKEKINALENISLTDFLTGAYNKRAFEIIADSEISYAIRDRKSRDICLIIFDIDYFKEINDTFGHDAGDYVLSKIGESVPLILRNYDSFFRLGGDEFGILTRDNNINGGIELAKRIKQEISKIKINDASGRKITISAGVANFNGTCNSIDDFYKRADNALYIAKHNGRNNVCAYNPYELAQIHKAA